MSGQCLRSNCSVAECVPEKSSWCRNEQVCQGVKCKALCAVQWTGYIRTNLYRSFMYVFGLSFTLPGRMGRHFRG